MSDARWNMLGVARQWLNEDNSRTVTLLLAHRGAATGVRFQPTGRDYVIAIVPARPEQVRLIRTDAIVEVVYNIPDPDLSAKIATLEE